MMFSYILLWVKYSVQIQNNELSFYHIITFCIYQSNLSG